MRYLVYNLEETKGLCYNAVREITFPSYLYEQSSFMFAVLKEKNANNIEPYQCLILTINSVYPQMHEPILFNHKYFFHL